VPALEDVVNSLLLRRIAREHRHLVIPILALAVLNVVLVVAFIVPLSRRVGNVTERTQLARNELSAARFAHKRVSDALHGKSQASEQLARFYNMVLPANLVDARRLVFPRLELMAKQSNLRATNTTVEHVSERDHALEELRIHMLLTGTYNGVRDFIQRLEHSKDFLVINRLVLKESDVEKAPLALQLELSTYFKEKAK
jgi:hypothetical protein